MQGHVSAPHLVRVVLQFEHFRMHTQLVSGANDSHLGSVWWEGRGGGGEVIRYITSFMAHMYCMYIYIYIYIYIECLYCYYYYVTVLVLYGYSVRVGIIIYILGYMVYAPRA